MSQTGTMPMSAMNARISWKHLMACIRHNITDDGEHGLSSQGPGEHAGGALTALEAILAARPLKCLVIGIIYVDVLNQLALIDHIYQRHIDFQPTPFIYGAGGMHCQWIRACKDGNIMVRYADGNPYVERTHGKNPSKSKSGLNRDPLRYKNGNIRRRRKVVLLSY
ncbi:hypothetical protein THAOC_34843 [Thalassiosira oceanica]|uniref:Uncharacterized protein n=1 Tax=Thalassiosira oceanica TaxID=159749 RepID=K0R1V0_THAOC|nr:hypothetical protein THAOC_34843 [Thalassiosira oceanica]|eukprot:EJK46483.1 hypothetical protein THAOC_34843 [Thalassiosira oceanica]